MAIVVHSTSQNVTATSTAGTAISHPLNIRDVPERYLLVAVGYKTTSGGSSSVVWRPDTAGAADQAMTLLASQNNATGTVRIELWGLLAPSYTTVAGSAVRITPNVAVSVVYGATCLQGVDQTTPFIGYVNSSSIPTNWQARVGTTTASGTGDMAVTTAVGETVFDAFVSDMAATTNNFWAGGRETYFQRQNTATSGVRVGLASKIATTTTTNVSWISYGGGTAGFNSGQSGRGFAMVGVPLRPSTSVPPYHVRAPHAPVAVQSSSGIGNARFNNLDVAGGVWPTANGGMERYSAGAAGTGPAEILSGPLSAYTLTSRTGTIITGTPASGSITINDIFQVSSQAGHAGVATVKLCIPSTCVADDIMLVCIDNEVNTVTVSGVPAGFTQIATVATASTFPSRLTAYWARLTLTQITAGSVQFDAAGATFMSACAVFYRGCITSGSPIGTGAAAPTTNSGTAGTTITATGLTTTQANMTGIMFAVSTDGTNKVWTPPVGANGIAQRESFHEVFIGEHQQLTAGAIPDQTMGTATQAWLSIFCALIPAASTATNYTRGISSMSAVATTRSVARRMLPYRRAVAAMSAVSTTRTATRKGAPFRRAVAAMNAVATTRTLGNVLVYVRRPNAMVAVATTRSVARTATYRRTVLRTGSVLITVNALKTTPGGTLHTRGISAMVAVATARTVSRKMAPYKRAIASMSAVATTRSVTRKGSPLRRSVAAMSAVATTRTVSRKMASYKRSVTATSGLARVVTVSRSIQTGVVGWVDYEQTIGAPWLVTIADMPNTFPGCTFLFEAQLRSLVIGQKVYARLATYPGNVPVPDSQIETSSPHQDWQIVRSTTSLGLASGQYYKAQVGKVSPHQGQIAYADVIVRDVA